MSDPSLNPRNWTGYQVIGPGGSVVRGGTFDAVPSPGNATDWGTSKPVDPKNPGFKLPLWDDPVTQLGKSLGLPGWMTDKPAGDVLGGAADAAGGAIESYFVRVIVVILGFIFVAVGLYMMTPANPVQILHK